MSKKSFNRLGTSGVPKNFSAPDKKDQNQFHNNCVNCGKYVKVISPIDTATEAKEKSVLCPTCYNMARQSGQIPIVNYERQRANERAKARKQSKK